MKMMMKIQSLLLVLAISSLTGLTPMTTTEAAGVVSSDASDRPQIRGGGSILPQRRKTTSRVKGALRKNNKNKAAISDRDQEEEDHEYDHEHRYLKKDKDKDDGSDIDVDDIIGIGCFSEIATAQVEGRGNVPMKDLQVGDKVLVGGSTTNDDYQPIYFFGHKSPNVMGDFYQLHTTSSSAAAASVLEVTGEHLLYLKDELHPVRADSLQVGDSLLLGSQGIDKTTITKITTIERRGLYAPFTTTGTVVVNGILASSYISLQDPQENDMAKTGLVQLSNGRQLLFLSQHDLVHTWFAPLRLLCMGVSSNFCRPSNNDHEGLPLYASWSHDVSLWVDQQHFVVQTLVLVSFLLVFVPLMLAETVFGSSLAPVAIFVLSSLLFGRVRSRRNNNSNDTKKGL